MADGADSIAACRTSIDQESEETSLLRNRKAILDQEVSVPLPVIYRADSIVRDSNREHFEGRVISLGLFGRWSWIGFKDWTTGKDMTREMDPFKIDVLIAFLADIGKGPEDWVEIRREVVDKPLDMKRLYDQKFCFDLSSETIQSALALDAICVTCFLGHVSGIIDNSPSSPWRFSNIFSLLERNSIRKSAFLTDIFKMENQIPLVLLRNVISIFVQTTRRKGPVEEHRTMDAAYGRLRDQMFQQMYSYPRDNRMRFFPSFQILDSDSSFESYHHLLHGIAEAFRCATKSQKSNLKQRREKPNSSFTFEQLPTATELHKRGVRFKVHDEFSPRFEQNMFGWAGTLFLPKINFIALYSEQAWRNLVAWESQYEGNMGIQPFTNYFFLMDKLIDTERDVAFLREGKNPVIGIVDIGDNQAVAELFNSIAFDMMVDPEDKWFSVVQEINDFHNHTVGKLLGEFVQTYCSRPWLIISILAAFILLAGTVFQTVYTVKSYYVNSAGP